MIIVRTAGGSHCEVIPGSDWTCRDLHADIQMKLWIPASQQRLLHGSKLLEDFMAASAVGTMDRLLQLSGGGTLELSLYIRSYTYICTYTYIHISYICIYTYIHIHIHVCVACMIYIC